MSKISTAPLEHALLSLKESIDVTQPILKDKKSALAKKIIQEKYEVIQA